MEHFGLPWCPFHNHITIMNHNSQDMILLNVIFVCLLSPLSLPGVVYTILFTNHCCLEVVSEFLAGVLEHALTEVPTRWHSDTHSDKVMGVIPTHLVNVALTLATKPPADLPLAEESWYESIPITISPLSCWVTRKQSIKCRIFFWVNPLTVKFSNAHVLMCWKCLLQANHPTHTYKLH